jgi:hypothetical protein
LGEVGRSGYTRAAEGEAPLCQRNGKVYRLNFFVLTVIGKVYLKVNG